MRLPLALSASLLALLAVTPACAQQPAANPGAPVEQGPPNIPANRPAFPGQTRAPAVSSPPFTVTTVAKGLDRPWSLAFLPDGRMLVTEKPGRLRIVAADGRVSAPVPGAPRVLDEDQGGLLDVVLAPDFARSRTLYLSYAEPRGQVNGLAVARARLTDGPTPKLEALSVIFRVQPGLDSTKHNGGRMAFGPDGKLYVTCGERSILPGRMQAQRLDADLGKIVRLNPDGSTPADNPFVSRAGARPEIWTQGHRNPLSLAFDGRGRLWEVEMGPRGGDEVNLIARGRDYGWPTIGYGEEYSGQPIHASTQAPGMEQPLYYWDPVISPSGLAVYSGGLFPAWRGDLFIGALSGKALVRLAMRDGRVVGEERLLTERHRRIRDVRQGPDGALYLLTDGEGGELWRLTPGRG